MKNFVLTAALLLAVVFTATGQKTVPSYEVKTLEGKTVNLQDYVGNGKITIVTYWATWCAPCKKELDNWLDYYEEWAEEYNVEIIAVSVDNARTATKVQSTVDVKGWPYTILTDVNGASMQQMNFQAVPYMFIADAEGNIVYEHAGYREGDEYEVEDKLKALTE